MKLDRSDGEEILLDNLVIYQIYLVTLLDNIIKYNLDNLVNSSRTRGKLHKGINIRSLSIISRNG